MDTITPIGVTPLRPDSGERCMSKLPHHRGRIYEVELPHIPVPPGKRAILYLCEACTAHLILSTCI